MSAYALQDKPLAYLYDGSVEGLLSAVFLAYERHEAPEELVCDRVYAPRLGQDSLVVRTDYERALRVRRGIERAAGRATFTALLRASTIEDYETGSAVFRFVRLVFDLPEGRRHSPVLDDRANPVVEGIASRATRCVNECERMRQFVRFSHLENGVWFARCNPNANVVPLVMGYFADRLNDQPFIIYDEVRSIAGVYDGRSWELVKSDAMNIPKATDHDRAMQEAWKRFYDALSVEARYNPELRRHFAPTRLWRNLTEMQPRA